MSPVSRVSLRAGSRSPVDTQQELSNLCAVGGRYFAAGERSISVLNEQGVQIGSLPTTISQPSLSSHSSHEVVLGDPVGRSLEIMDVHTGDSQPWLSLDDVIDPEPARVPNGNVLASGTLASVASDGQQAFVAISAGFSSAVFKIDTQTQKIVDRTWAGASDPTAMTFDSGGLYVLVGRGSTVAKFDNHLNRCADSIGLHSKGARGLVVQRGRIVVLEDRSRSLARFPVDESQRSICDVRPSHASRIRPDWRADFEALLNRSRKYAILICGDLAESFWGECFWNDTVWMYKALLANGYRKENIFVLYGDGHDYDSANPTYQYPQTVTDIAATPTNVKMVLDGLKNGDPKHRIPKLRSTDTLFVWTFDHGSTIGDESHLCLRGGTIGATDFSTRLNALSYKSRAIFMQQCYSGGFIPGLQNSRTFISTACRADEVANCADMENELYDGLPYSHGEYNYHLISALDRATPEGVDVNADSNGDKPISASEMHNWVVGHESRPETPQLADSHKVGADFTFKK